MFCKPSHKAETWRLAIVTPFHARRSEFLVGKNQFWHQLLIPCPGPQFMALRPDINGSSEGVDCSLRNKDNEDIAA
jgi:hypothetical protein